MNLYEEDNAGYPLGIYNENDSASLLACLRQKTALISSKRKRAYRKRRENVPKKPYKLGT